jgi:hypothetical protein
MFRTGRCRSRSTVISYQLNERIFQNYCHNLLSPSSRRRCACRSRKTAGSTAQTIRSIRIRVGETQRTRNHRLSARIWALRGALCMFCTGRYRSRSTVGFYHQNKPRFCDTFHGLPSAISAPGDTGAGGEGAWSVPTTDMGRCLFCIGINVPSPGSLLGDVGAGARSVSINKISHDSVILFMVYRLQFLYREIQDPAAKEHGQFLQGT